MANRQSLDDMVSSLVSWIDVAVQRKRWSNEQIEQSFAKRSSRQILEEGHTHYMGPCLDLTQVMQTLLQRRGVQPVLVMEEYTSNKYHLMTLHFALEIPSTDGTYTLDFTTRNDVEFRKGTYINRIETPIDSRVFRFPQRLDENTAFTDTSDFSRTTSRYRPSMHLARLKSHNTGEIYRSYQQAIAQESHFRINPSR